LHEHAAAQRDREPAHSAGALRDRRRREPPGDKLVAPPGDRNRERLPRDPGRSGQ
jgi:hypothetical protein